jgi:hypothetical protein
VTIAWGSAIPCPNSGLMWPACGLRSFRSKRPPARNRPLTCGNGGAGTGIRTLGLRFTRLIRSDLETPR